MLLKENKKLTKEILFEMFDDNDCLRRLIKDRQILDDETMKDLNKSMSDALYTSYILYGLPMNDKSNFNCKTMVVGLLRNNTCLIDFHNNKEVVTPSLVYRMKLDFEFNYKQFMSHINDTNYMSAFYNTYEDESNTWDACNYNTKMSVKRIKLVKERAKEREQLKHKR